MATTNQEAIPANYVLFAVCNSISNISLTLNTLRRAVENDDDPVAEGNCIFISMIQDELESVNKELEEIQLGLKEGRFS